MNETTQLIVQLVSNLGFPIAMCCYFCWSDYIKNKGFQESIDNNTKALIEIKEYLRK